MDQQQTFKTNALHAAVWPLGKPENAREIPMWQETCREWVGKFLQPTCVTHLITELIECSNSEDPETTAYDIEQALDARGNWREVCEEAGWLSCEDLIEEMGSGLPTNRAQLIKLLNLALQGSASAEIDTDSLFYWIRSTPSWSEDRLVYTKELLTWEEMMDVNATRRAGGDAIVEAATEELPTYSLAFASPLTASQFRSHPLGFSDDDGLQDAILEAAKLSELPSVSFQTMERLLEDCCQSSIDWVTAEWLEPNGFVNFDKDEWSQEAQWHELGKEYSLEDEVSRNEVVQWFIVEEFAGEMLRELGEVIVPLVGSSNLLFGRDQGGQALYSDGVIARAMIRSGYLDNIPPLGALNLDEETRPRGLHFTLGGEEFPFRLTGWSEHRPNQELEDILLKAEYLEADWEITWGPEFTSEKEGMVRTFKVARAVIEGL